MSLRLVILWSLALGSRILSGEDDSQSEAIAEMLAAGRAVLGRQIAGEIAKRDRLSEGAAADLIFAISALAGTVPGTEEDPHAPVIEQARALLRSQQKADGSFLATPEAIEATWYTLTVFAASSDEGDQKAFAAARKFVQNRQLAAVELVPSKNDAITNALRFLGKVPAGASRERSLPAQPGAAGVELLGPYAGGPLDSRRVRQLLLARFRGDGSSLTQSLGLPNRAGILQDVHLAVRALAAYRNPRLVDEEGRVHLWPHEFLKTISGLRSTERGWWSREAAGKASLAATAAAVLALDALGPWLVTVPPPEAMADAERREARKPAELPEDCEACHARLHPGLVHQWRSSRHSSVEVGCAACHGKNHSQIFRENGAVSPRVCGGCHAREAAEFAASKHARAEASLVASALFAATPEPARGSCRACHAIGNSRADGSSGSCSFCHSAHAMSSAEAREPEACTGCHTGDDYPQALAYRLSKHGAIYTRTRDPGLSPTCASCHQPGGNHGTSFGITVGGSGSGGYISGAAPAIPMEPITLGQFADNRAEMVRICVSCHSSRFAEASLIEADRLKQAGNATLLEAATILRGLHEEGRLAGKAGGPLALGGNQIRLTGESPGHALLNRFYDMWRFHYAWTWKGAYHSSPSVANLESRPGLEADLDWIQSQAGLLRKERKPNAQLEIDAK